MEKMNNKNKSLEDLFDENLKKMKEPFIAIGVVPSKEARFGMAMAAMYRAEKEYQKQEERSSRENNYDRTTN